MEQLELETSIAAANAKMKVLGDTGESKMAKYQDQRCLMEWSYILRKR